VLDGELDEIVQRFRLSGHVNPDGLPSRLQANKIGDRQILPAHSE
jgi:hypothetical protein